MPDMCNTKDPTADPTIDPTIDPTTDPTTDPTNAPTYSPSAAPSYSPSTAPTFSPTTDPTIDPTADPTADPTVDPTVEPTFIPTDVPIQDPCDHIQSGAITLDTFFVVDKSCQSSLDNDGDYCTTRQKMIAELMTSIKGADTETAKRIASRVGYLEFGATFNDIMVRVGIDDGEYNHGAVSTSEVQAYYNEIAGFGCGSFVKAANTTDLESALDYVLDTFVSAGRGDATKKIVVISECENTPHVTNPSIKDICDDSDGGVFDRITDQDEGVDLIFVNLGSETAPDYGSCLASSNVHSFDLTGGNVGYGQIVQELQIPICDIPTSAPTS